MVAVCCANKFIVGNVQQLPEILKLFCHTVNVLLGCNAFLFCLLLNLQAVLVGPGEEHHVIALHPPVTGNRVTCKRTIAVPDMRLAGRIVNRRCDVKCLFSHFLASGTIYF